MLFAQAWAVLALLGVASANNVAQPPHLAREQVGARIIAELAARTNKPSIEVARQLLGGGSDYAPYSVDCPSDLTWIRSADVGFDVLYFPDADSYRACHRENNPSLSKGSNISRSSTPNFRVMVYLHRPERRCSEWHYLVVDTEP